MCLGEGETEEKGWRVSRCKKKRAFASVRQTGTVGKIFDCQPEGPGFNPRHGRRLNFERPSFATPFMDRDVKALD